jgi:hypothetical protein
MLIYNTALWANQQYIGWAWTDITTWPVTPNASETVAGKVQEATQTQVNNATGTGSTWAELYVNPSKLPTAVADYITNNSTVKAALDNEINALYFGDGSDWNVTISTNTTLTKDMFYNNLTIDASFNLNPWWYKIYVSNVLTINWSISITPNNWTNWGIWTANVWGAWWAALPNTSVWTQQGWGNGATWTVWNWNGNVWSPTSALINCFSPWKWWNSWAGWSAGIQGWAAAATGGAVQAWILKNKIVKERKDIIIYWNLSLWLYNSITAWAGWSSWASFAWANWRGGWGGWGGSAWWIVFIVANSVVIWATGSISANGWNGWNGANWVGSAWNSNVAAGWGGWGWGWGWAVAIVHNTFVNNGSISVNGWNGWNGWDATVSWTALAGAVWWWGWVWWSGGSVYFNKTVTVWTITTTWWTWWTWWTGIGWGASWANWAAGSIGVVYQAV